MKQTIVTTSWDDGHILDTKLAELLTRYDLGATFYIAPANREIPEHDRLSGGQIRELSKRFEIGAHTMTHPRLSAIGDEAAQKEIDNSKFFLEDIIGKDVTSFCYPGGVNTGAHQRMVKSAGFSLARTTKRFSLDVGKDPFALPTTIHAYRHWSDMAPIARRSRSPWSFLKNYSNWDDLAVCLFDEALVHGGLFHLWGHSWEIDQNNDWKRLERVFQHIAHRTDIIYLPNSKLIPA